MKKTIVVAVLAILTGCTHRIKFNSLDIGLLLTDIPEECNPTRKLNQCIVKINTPCHFEKDVYLNKMLGSDNGRDGDNKRNGIFCAPDVDTAVVYVYSENETKHVELTMSRGKITSLQIWNGSQLLNEVKGSLGRDKQDGKYYFLSGTQKIYKEYDLVLERISDYKDGCQEFIELEKRYIVNDNLSYYKFTQKKYVNYYDGHEAYYYGKTLDNINYRKIEDAKYTITGVRYEDEYENPLPISDVLSIETQPYILYKTSVVKDGKSTYLAIFRGNYESSFFDGVFFTSQDPNIQCTLEHAVNLIFGTANNDEEYCSISAINDYEPRSPTYVYKVSIDSLGHIVFQYDGNAKFPPTHMEYFHAPYHPWLEDGLRKRLKEERDISLERYRREREYEKQVEAINARMVEVPCPECGGKGRITQSGMGVVLGSLSCPCCHGQGTIRVDPYSAADRELYNNILYN